MSAANQFRHTGRIISVLKTQALKPLCPPLYNILQYNSDSNFCFRFR